MRIRVWRIEHETSQLGPYYHQPPLKARYSIRLITKIAVARGIMPDEVCACIRRPRLSNGTRQEMRQTGFVLRLLEVATSDARLAQTQDQYFIPRHRARVVKEYRFGLPVQGPVYRSAWD
jgi:hypothetical protein